MRFSRMTLNPRCLVNMLCKNTESGMQVFIAACVFIAWTVTTFICHESGKLFLLLSEKTLHVEESASQLSSVPHQRFSLAFILTTVQCVTCLMLVSPGFGNKGILQSRAALLLLATHGLATLATNYSMAYIEASSTLAIKLTEPVTMAIGHHMVSQTIVPLQTAISIPIIISGAVVFADLHAHHNFMNLIGALLAFASNVILTARNLTLKNIQDSNAAMDLRPLSHIARVVLAEVGLVAWAAYLHDIHLGARNAWVLLALCLTSGVFHVTYSYISTNVVLRVMNVVSHSIANIFKRFLVVLLLYVAGNRQLTAINFFGLCIALCGLLIYTHGKKRANGRLEEQDVEAETSNSEPFRGKLYAAVGCMALVIVAVIISTGRMAKATVSTPATDNITSNTHGENHNWGEYRMPSVDFSHILNEETDPAMREFLKRRLIDTPEDTDKRAKLLTSNKRVIEESQRILVNLLQDLLGQAKHVMLIEIATYENKGDPAISVGEVMLLRILNVSIVFYCDIIMCTRNTSLQEALHVNSQYAKDELVLLLQGGGNLVGYQSVDKVRKRYISSFPNRRIIMFSQSIWLRPNNTNQLEYSRSVYSNRSNLVMFLRDRQSLEIARANFQGVRLILAPDLAFCIGMVPRQFPPLYDIVWLKRGDTESSQYVLPSFPPNISVDVNDWHKNWHSNKGHTAMDTSFLIATEGFQFLQRGRVVVTDRLHGHILSTLMNIPHVLIDNPPFLKLSSFDKSWTASLRNTILVTNGSLALDAAMELLRTYDKSLPLVGPRDMYVGFNGNVRKAKG